MATQQQIAPSLPIHAGPRPLGHSQLSHRQAPTPPLEPSTEDAPKTTAAAPEDAPPAYTPPIRTRLQESLAAALMSSNPGLAQHLSTIPLVPTAALRADSPDPDEIPYEELSPINLRISARVNIARDNNIIALPFTPAEQANSIADAIVKAFKSGTVAENGLPMIDEAGRPRPVKIEVDAGINVEGVNNVVGTEGAVLEIVKARHEILKQRMASLSGSSAAGPSDGPPTAERRKSVAAGIDEPPAKRQRQAREA